jgi:hypothetical protein
MPRDQADLEPTGEKMMGKSLNHIDSGGLTLNLSRNAD